MPQGKRPLRRPRQDRGIILKWMLKNRLLTGFNWLRMRSSGGMM
jgi:hypothetical protein